jgi:hypothetical protein
MLTTAGQALPLLPALPLLLRNTMRYDAEIKFNASFETDGAPEDVINALMDLFQTIDTTHINLVWDDVEWTID